MTTTQTVSHAKQETPESVATLIRRGAEIFAKNEFPGREGLEQAHAYGEISSLLEMATSGDTDKQKFAVSRVEILIKLAKGE